MFYASNTDCNEDLCGGYVALCSRSERPALCSEPLGCRGLAMLGSAAPANLKVILSQ